MSFIRCPRLRIVHWVSIKEEGVVSPLFCVLGNGIGLESRFVENRAVLWLLRGCGGFHGIRS